MGEEEGESEGVLAYGKQSLLLLLLLSPLALSLSLSMAKRAAPSYADLEADLDVCHYEIQQLGKELKAKNRELKQARTELKAKIEALGKQLCKYEEKMKKECPKDFADYWYWQYVEEKKAKDKALAEKKVEEEFSKVLLADLATGKKLYERVFAGRSRIKEEFAKFKQQVRDIINKPFVFTPAEIADHGPSINNLKSKKVHDKMSEIEELVKEPW